MTKFYSTAAEANAAAIERLLNEGRPPHMIVAVFERADGTFEVGTWPAGRSGDLPETAWQVRLPG